MTPKTWHDIWASKQNSKGFDFTTAKSQDTLKELLSCNGFNSATGSFNLHAYQRFIAKIFAQARLESASSLYEVGCGAGAFLYALNAHKAAQNTISHAEAISAFNGGGGGDMSKLPLIPKDSKINTESTMQHSANYALDSTTLEASLKHATQASLSQQCVYSALDSKRDCLAPHNNKVDFKSESTSIDCHTGKSFCNEGNADSKINSKSYPNNFETHSQPTALNSRLESSVIDSKASPYYVSNDSKESTYLNSKFIAEYNPKDSQSLSESKHASTELQGFSLLGGIDYSASLASIAKRALPHAHITQGEAIEIDSSTYDCVCSFSAFHYFPSIEYAREVAIKMIAKARQCVLFLDILDLGTKEADIAYKKQICGAAEYERLYGGTTAHLYYPREMFIELAKACGYAVRIEQQDIEGYENSPFRFNAIMYKE